MLLLLWCVLKNTIYFVSLLKLSTGRLSSEVLDSEKPVYAISKLSKAKKKPRIDDSIYSAFHGPTANNSKLLWYEKEEDGVTEKVFLTRDILQQSTQPLYLYHGKKSICIWSLFLSKIKNIVTKVLKKRKI